MTDLEKEALQRKNEMTCSEQESLELLRNLSFTTLYLAAKSVLEKHLPENPDMCFVHLLEAVQTYDISSDILLIRPTNKEQVLQKIAVLKHMRSKICEEIAIFEKQLESWRD